MKRHHIFCNYTNRDPETCSQCAMLNAKFPENGTPEQWDAAMKQQVKDANEKPTDRQNSEQKDS